MFLTDKYPECRYNYTVSLIRAIEEDYEEASTNGIDLYQRGCLIAHIANPFSIAEFRADYERGCKAIGRTAGGERMAFKEVLQIVEFLNGQ